MIAINNRALSLVPTAARIRRDRHREVHRRVEERSATFFVDSNAATCVAWLRTSPSEYIQKLKTARIRSTHWILRGHSNTARNHSVSPPSRRGDSPAQRMLDNIYCSAINRYRSSACAFTSPRTSWFISSSSCTGFADDLCLPCAARPCERKNSKEGLERGFFVPGAISLKSRIFHLRPDQPSPALSHSWLPRFSGHFGLFRRIVRFICFAT